MAAAVLYVDDDQANLTVFEAMCRNAFPVLTASGGRQALELMRQHDVGVLLTDQRMPGMTGAQLAALASEEFPDTVRYLVTAYSDLDAAIEAINDGQIRRYIRKPWDPDDLRGMLRDALDLFETTRRIRSMERRMVRVERVYALGVVAASIAHEIRNPITVVTGTLDLARMRLEQLAADMGRAGADAELIEDARELVEYIDSADKAAQRVIKVMKGIQMSTQRRDSEETADLHEVVDATLHMLMGDLAHRARLDVDLEHVPRVYGSSTKLGQIVLNLLLNSAQAFESQSSDDNLLRIRARPHKDSVRLEIEDNGPGIPEDIRDQIFDPFFTTKSNGGTGLGLAITKQIVEDIGGAIELDTTTERGTRFVVTLPMADKVVRSRAAGG